MTKVSRNVQTLLIAPVVLAAAIAATGCEPDVAVNSYQSPDECTAAGVYDAGTCKSAYDQALARHKIYAPSYESKKDCEEDWGDGKCDTKDEKAPTQQAQPEYGLGMGEQQPAPAQSNTTSGGSSGGSHGTVIYHPWLYGYTVSPSPSASSAPIYRSRGGEFMSDSGQSIASRAFSRAGAQMGESHLSRPSGGSGARMSSGSSFSSARGGFGGTARGFSGGGAHSFGG